MPSHWFGPGVANLLSPARAAARTLRVLLVDATPGAGIDPDTATVAGLSVDELPSITGYAPGFAGAGRRSLANVAVTYDGAANTVRLDADDVVWTAVHAGQPIGGAVVYINGTSDADSVPVVYLDPADITTNGQDVTLQFATAGIATVALA